MKVRPDHSLMQMKGDTDTTITKILKLSWSWTKTQIVTYIIKLIGKTQHLGLLESIAHVDGKGELPRHFSQQI